MKQPGRALNIPLSCCDGRGHTAPSSPVRLDHLVAHGPGPALGHVGLSARPHTFDSPH